MTRFVELPIVSERGSVVWVNPDHVVAVEASHQDGKCWLVTEQGSRTHVDLSQEAVVACFHELDDEFQFVDVRDSVRENLTR